MATNREIHIDKLDNKTLALYLAMGCLIDEDNDIDIDAKLGDTIETRKILYSKAKDIEKWLSQEAKEEDKVIKNISSDYEKPEIIQITREAYKSILARLDKLENQKSIDSNHKTFEKEKTADQMFEDLGYRIYPEDTDFEIMYYKNIVGTTVRIGIGLKYDGYIYEKIFGDNQSELINQEEDIAIHKKISEMEKEGNYANK